MQIREEATEILVAGAVLDEEGDFKMCDLRLRVRQFSGGSHEGAEADLLSSEVGPGGSLDSHMVEESDGLIAKFRCTADKILRLAGAPEEGEGGAGVEFGEQVRSKVRKILSSPGPSGIRRTSFVDALKEPVSGRLAGETEEGLVGKLKIPFDTLPASGGIPPVARERKGAVNSCNGATVWSGQVGVGAGEASAGFAGNMNRKGGAIAFQWQGRLDAAVVKDWKWSSPGGGSDPGCPAAQSVFHLERIRLMSVDGTGSAESTRTEKGFQASEGVGESVRVSQGAIEEVVLSFAGQGGSEEEGPCHDGSGSADSVQMGVEKAKESGGGAGGFGQAQFTQVQVAVGESEGEFGGDGGALGGTKAGAEGVEAAAQDEEERFKALEGMFKFAGYGELLWGAMQVEETVVFAVQNVVEAGHPGAESFCESLAWEGGEGSQGVDAPELKEFRIRGQFTVVSLQRRERQVGNGLNAENGMRDTVKHRFRMEGESGTQGTAAPDEESKIWSGCDGEMERKTKSSGLAEGLFGPGEGGGESVGNRKEIE